MGIGTSIVTRAGPSAILASSQVRNQKATVYNFEVEKTHTYFVGHSDLWVHNVCKVKWVSFQYRGNGGIFEKAIDHIFDRHNIQSTATDASKFFSSYSNKGSLKTLISDGAWKATPSDIVQTFQNGDIRVVYDFGYDIGTSLPKPNGSGGFVTGSTTSKIEMYITAAGEIRTAYPL